MEKTILEKLSSRKLMSAGGAMGGICYIASLVVSGGLALPAGLAFAGIIAAVSAVHVLVQGQLDKKPKKEKEAPAETPG